MAFNTTLLRCSYCQRQIEDWLFFCLECREDFCSMCFVSVFEFGPHKTEHDMRVVNLGTYPVFDWKDYLTFNDNDNTESNVETSQGSSSKANKASNKPDLPRLITREPYFRKKVVESLQANTQIAFAELALDEPTNATRRRVWTINDEKLLLEAVIRFGIGNWPEIAASLNPQMAGLTPAEVEEHYSKHYVHGVMGQFFWQSCNRALPEKWNFISHVDDYFHSEPTQIDYSRPLQKIPQQIFDQIGYLPKRDDFEKEFDHEAESLIGHISVNTSILDDDDAMKAKLKETQIKMYKERLLMRLRKKSIVQNYDLISKFAQYYFLYGPPDLDIQKTIKKNDLSVATKTGDEILFFKPFLRFCSKDDLTTFYFNLQKEYLLKMCCLYLTKFKLLGCKSLSDIANCVSSNRKFKRIVSLDHDNFTKKIGLADENDQPLAKKVENAKQLRGLDDEIDDFKHHFLTLFNSSDKTHLFKQFSALLTELDI